MLHLLLQKVNNKIVYFIIVIFVLNSCNINHDAGRQYVYDEYGLLQLNEKDSIEMRLRAIEQKTTCQYSIFILNSLNNKSSLERGTELFDSLKFGKKGINNGLLLLIAPNEKSLRLLVGYGLEWQITDSIANEIIKSIMPYFAKQQFGYGINRSIDTISNIITKVPWEIKYKKDNINFISKEENYKNELLMISSKNILCNRDTCLLGNHHIKYTNHMKNGLIYEVPKSEKTILRIVNDSIFELIGVMY